MMSDLLSLASLDLLLAFCGAVLVYQYARTKPQKLPLPPGPKPLPVIGNLFEMPTVNTDLGPHWAKHKALYGPISSVSAFGTTLIIINDCEIAFELLERRSANYSNRPRLPFAREMCGLGLTTTLSPYGDTHRLHRKWMHNFMGSRSAMRNIEDVQEVEVHRLLYRMLKKPDGLMDHLRAVPSAVMLKISYDYNIAAEGPDELVDLADMVVKTVFSESTQAGRWLVDIIPGLRYIPEWLPGAAFKKTARVWNTYVYDFYEKPFKFVEHQIAAGKAGPSFVLNILEDESVEKVNDNDTLKYAASTIYGAGSDTSVSSMGTFFIAMMLYPDVLKRAQEELNHVVGDERLPRFADRDSLPYINAIVKETFRWESVVPTAVPHVTTEDDVYNGYLIPKGSIIVPNVWQMDRNTEYYSDPETFKPERFLGENGSRIEMDPRLMAFGFGRRICPGKDVADSLLFMTVAMSVATFNITKAKDEFGKEITPVRDYTVGIIRHPKPFKCSITPRSQKAIALIETVLDDHPFIRGDVDILKKL